MSAGAASNLLYLALPLAIIKHAKLVDLISCYNYHQLFHKEPFRPDGRYFIKRYVKYNFSLLF
jgi:hypothetical protein